MSVAQQWQELEDFGAEGIDIDYTAASARAAGNPALGAGRYYMISTTDCHVQRGTPSGATATAAAPSHFLKANTYWPFVVIAEDAATRDGVAAIQDTASGKLRIRKVSRK